MATNAYAPRSPVPGEAPKGIDRVYGRIAYAVQSNDPDATLVPGYDEGYSPALGQSEGRLPDEIRIGKREPLFGGPRTHTIHLRRGEEGLRRRDDETDISTGWPIKQAKKPIPVVPEWVQDIGPSRPTAHASPTQHLFMRPWDMPPPLTGEHFSMADHRRLYEIFGMVPRGGIGVNTYRVDPKPWDANLHYAPTPRPTDIGSESSPIFGGNRSFRLRG